LAFQLNQHGFPATYALLGGTAAWKNAGYPMESTTSPLSVQSNKIVEDPATQ
jgi:3-mercaptopyruvate sulfurtransferase SseA